MIYIYMCVCAYPCKFGQTAPPSNSLDSEHHPSGGSFSPPVGQGLLVFFVFLVFLDITVDHLFILVGELGIIVSSTFLIQNSRKHVKTSYIYIYVKPRIRPFMICYLTFFDVCCGKKTINWLAAHLFWLVWLVARLANDPPLLSGSSGFPVYIYIYIYIMCIYIYVST